MTSEARNNPAIVLDNGTGLTKIGFAGAAEPLEVLQSSIGKRFESVGRHSQISTSSPLENLDYVVGNPEFFSNNSNTYKATCPLKKNGVVGDWDGMEQLWTSCFYDILRINPEDHYVLLTEQIYNTPDARAETAEIMFETFNVPALMISPQVVLSLAASWTHEKSLTREMTGVVVDSGVGSTRIVPIVDGNVMSGAIEKIDIGGTDVTTFIINKLRQRKEPLPPGMAFDVAKDIKEKYCYTCPNIDKEISKYDSNPEKYIKTYEGIHKRTKKSFEVKVAYERFLAPEMVMNLQIHDSGSATTLSDLVDNAIMKCPIDTRRALYSNIVLSGGNTR